MGGRGLGRKKSLILGKIINFRWHPCAEVNALNDFSFSMYFSFSFFLFLFFLVKEDILNDQGIK